MGLRDTKHPPLYRAWLQKLGVAKVGRKDRRARLANKLQFFRAWSDTDSHSGLGGCRMIQRSTLRKTKVWTNIASFLQNFSRSYIFVVSSLLVLIVLARPGFAQMFRVKQHTETISAISGCTSVWNQMILSGKKNTCIVKWNLVVFFFQWQLRAESRSQKNTLLTSVSTHEQWRNVDFWFTTIFRWQVRGALSSESLIKLALSVTKPRRMETLSS